MTKHYHVLVGLQGLYMPNDNTVCQTKREAQDCAKWWADQARDNGERVTGSAKSGYYTLGEHECVEITECSEPECLEGLEG